MARAMCREAAWRLAKNILKFEGETQNNILLTFADLLSVCVINP